MKKRTSTNVTWVHRHRVVFIKITDSVSVMLRDEFSRSLIALGRKYICLGSVGALHMHLLVHSVSIHWAPTVCQPLCWTLSNPEMSTKVPLHGLDFYSPFYFGGLLQPDSFLSVPQVLAGTAWLLVPLFCYSYNFSQAQTSWEEKKSFLFWLFSISTSFCFITKSIATSSLQAKLLRLSGLQAFKYTWYTFSLSHLHSHSPINPSFHLLVHSPIRSSIHHPSIYWADTMYQALNNHRPSTKKLIMWGGEYNFYKCSWRVSKE